MHDSRGNLLSTPPGAQPCRGGEDGLHREPRSWLGMSERRLKEGLRHPKTLASRRDSESSHVGQSKRAPGTEARQSLPSVLAGTTGSADSEPDSLHHDPRLGQLKPRSRTNYAVNKRAPPDSAQGGWVWSVGSSPPRPTLCNSLPKDQRVDNRLSRACVQRLPSARRWNQATESTA